MNLAFPLQAMQVGIGLCLVVYAVWLVAKRLKGVRLHLPSWPAATCDTTSDLRVLVDMAARLRDTGNAAAVKACQTLIDELLQPKTPPT